jgi:hypothetical protein
MLMRPSFGISRRRGSRRAIASRSAGSQPIGISAATCGRDTGPHKCVLIRARRHRGDGIGGLQYAWLQTPGKRARCPALCIDGAAVSTANLASPRADPGILVIEDERNIEMPFEHRPEHRRIRWVDGDEQCIEPAGAVSDHAARRSPGSARNPRSPIPKRRVTDAGIARVRMTSSEGGTSAPSSGSTRPS